MMYIALPVCMAGVGSVLPFINETVGASAEDTGTPVHYCRASWNCSHESSIKPSTLVVVEPQLKNMHASTDNID